MSIGKRVVLFLAMLLCAAVSEGFAQNPTWTQKSPATTPTARSYHALTYDSFRQQVVLFGGQLQIAPFGSLLNDTWVWNGSTWTQKFPTNSPPPRTGHAMAFDATRGQVVLFGGYGVSGFPNATLGDTWVWDGNNWTQKFPVTNPPLRFWHAMTYDPAHQQVVLFGGAIGGFGSGDNDIWVWDGNNFTIKLPVTSPPGRFYHDMTYDVGRGQVLLYGGNNNARDTWVWDGNNWTRIFPPTSPTASWGHSLAYDASSNRVLLFGGADVTGSGLSETWLWDGNTWSQQFPSPHPDAVVGSGIHHMTFDATRAQAVVFATTLTSVFQPVTWVWDAASTPGTISVTTNLPAATFTITGPANYSGSGPSFIQTNAPAGTYTITYGATAGYQSPSPETKALPAGGSVAFSGTYQNLVGKISVSVQPNSATYNISGPAGFSGLGSATYPAMPAGQYTISFLPITGYSTPSSQTKTLLLGSAIAFTASYQLAPGTGSLRIQVTPSTATYNVVGPAGFSGIGSNTYSGLPVGTYAITFLPLIGPGIITPIPQTVLLQANQTIPVTGKYLSSVSPPTLKITSGSVCVSPICVSTNITDRGPTFVTATVTVSNITGAWYELDMQFDGPTTTAPNPIVVDTAKIPTAFLIGPFKTATFPGVTFQAGQYFAINAEKYSVASTSMLAIDMITRGLFGVEIDSSWSGRLDLTLAELQALSSTTELGAPGAAVAFGLCRDNLCRIQQLADFVSKATQDPKVWAAVKALVGKVFGPNTIQQWSDIGGKSFGEVLGLFTGIPKLAVLMDQTFSSPNFGGFRIEAVR